MSAGMDDGSAPAAVAAPAVDIVEVSKWYSADRTPDQVVLDRISLQVNAGEFVTIVGPSGCGKSTLLKMVAGLDQPSSGTIEVVGRTPEQARRDHLYSIAFQRPGLLEWRDVGANISLPLQLAGIDRAERDRRVRDLLELVGLVGIERRHVWELSGGMQQRVALARALAVQPELLLLDEPFAALDELTRERLQSELARLQRETSIAVMMVTHSIREAVLLGDRTIVLGARPGRVVASLSTGPDERFETCVEQARNALADGD